eukprot:1207690-Alexandrium_andersonii.AAC.1
MPSSMMTLIGSSKISSKNRRPNRRLRPPPNGQSRATFVCSGSRPSHARSAVPWPRGCLTMR